MPRHGPSRSTRSGENQRRSVYFAAPSPVVCGWAVPMVLHIVCVLTPCLLHLWGNSVPWRGLFLPHDVRFEKNSRTKFILSLTIFCHNSTEDFRSLTKKTTHQNSHFSILYDFSKFCCTWLAAAVPWCGAIAAPVGCFCPTMCSEILVLKKRPHKVHIVPHKILPQFKWGF